MRTVELPRMLLGEKLTVLLIAAVAVALEASLALHPDAPVGLGLVAATMLLIWQRHSFRRRPEALLVGDPASAERAIGHGRARFADWGWSAVTIGPETRCLGPSLVLHWQGTSRSGMLWLTPWDVPRHELRRWALQSTARVGAVR